MKGGVAMRVMERDGRRKKEIDYQVVPKAPNTTGFVPPTADILFETRRRQRAYAIRGI
jgi:prephenate dehydratase